MQKKPVNKEKETSRKGHCGFEIPSRTWQCPSYTSYGNTTNTSKILLAFNTTEKSKKTPFSSKNSLNYIGKKNESIH